jgi:hypothetical protein
MTEAYSIQRTSLAYAPGGTPSEGRASLRSCPLTPRCDALNSPKTPTSLSDGPPPRPLLLQLP